jgi:hypothetical protein
MGSQLYTFSMSLLPLYRHTPSGWNAIDLKTTKKQQLLLVCALCHCVCVSVSACHRLLLRQTLIAMFQGNWPSYFPLVAIPFQFAFGNLVFKFSCCLITMAVTFGILWQPRHDPTMDYLHKATVTARVYAMIWLSSYVKKKERKKESILHSLDSRRIPVCAAHLLECF